MASPDLVTILTSDGDVDLFLPTDIYRYDVDNRPLRNLILNDQALQTGANLVIEEVYDARTNTVPFQYASLKDRLDDMDLLSGQAAKTNLFSQIQDRAALYRAQFASGFFHPTGDVYDANVFDVVSASNIHIPYGAICVRDRNANDSGSNLTTSIPLNSVWISTHAGTRTPFISKPLEAMLAGYHVRLFNESANGASAAGFTNGVSILFNAAPATGQRYDLAFLEFWFASVDKGLANTGATDSFYEYGAVDSNNSRTVDQAEPSVQGTIWFDPDNPGNYIQIRHRIRVVNDVDYANKPFGINDTAKVEARGGAGSPVGGKTFSPGLSVSSDPAIWVAGDGSGADKTAFSSFDGRVYGVPLMIVSRKNTAAWSLANQNGGTGRPDGSTHDKFCRGDILDLRPRAFTDRQQASDLAEEAMDRLIRGRLLTAFSNLTYETGTDLNTFSDATNAYGTELLEVNQINSAATSHAHNVRDFDDGVITGLAKPTSFRRVFSPSRDDQVQGFHINLNGGATTPSDFVQWNGGTSVITLKAAGNSGNGPSTARIKETPIMVWRTSHAPVAVVGGAWSGIGTNTATATVDTGDSFYDALDSIDAAATINWPQSTGLRHSPTRIEYQDYQDPTSAVTATLRATGLAGGTGGSQGPTGLFVTADGHMYVCDTSNHRLLRYDSTFTIDGQFPGAIGSLPGSGSDNSHLNSPQGVGVDAAGNIYIADTGNHRLVKINPSMTYLGQFGFTGVAAADNTHLSSPQGVWVGTNCYVSDTGNARVIRLDPSTLTYVSQFGVTGVPGQDDSHCIQPTRVTAGIGRVIVADQTRVLVLNPAGMTLDRILVGGQGYQDGTAISALNAIKSLSYAEDSLGNRYVGGGGTSAIFKFDSNYQFLAKFGTGSNDLTGLWYGPADPNKTIHCGLPRNIAVDEGNGLVYVADNTFGVSPQYGRVLILNSADLTYNSEYLVTNPRPWMDGSPGLPKHPTPNYATPDVNIALDVSGQKLYILLDILGTVEKWDISASPTNSTLWSYVSKFGAGTWSATAFGNFTGWRTSGDNATRMSYPQTIAVSQDGASLYVGDINLLKLLTAPILTHSASRLIRIDAASMTASGWWGDMNATDGDTDGGVAGAFAQYITGIVALDSSHDRIYVTDGMVNPPVLIALQHSASWSGYSPGVFKEAIKDSTWISSRIKSGPNQNNFLAATGHSYDGKTLFINPGWFTQRWTLDAGISPTATPDNPVRIFLSLAGGTIKPIQSSQQFVGVTGVSYDSSVTPNRLVISDQTNNEIFVVTVQLDKSSLPSDYTILGEAGTAGVSAFGFGGWAHPTSVALINIGGVDYFYYTDFYNGSLQRSSPYFAFVERGTGRIESLLPPPSGSALRFYSRYTPYQGVYDLPDYLGNSNHESSSYMQSMWASRLVVKPTKIMATTLGRVGIDSGDLVTETAYASPLSHLPLPFGTNTEYEWTGSKMLFAGDMIEPSALVTLPIIQFGSQPSEWETDSESFYERSTRIGLGQVALANNHGADSYSGASNDFPVVKSFALAQAVPHINYTWGVVDYYGEQLLFVRGSLNLNDKNIVGPRVNPFLDKTNAIELYRMPGNPFAKFIESRG